MKRLPSCSISVSVSESRSAMISGQEPERPSAAMRSSSAALQHQREEAAEHVAADGLVELVEDRPGGEQVLGGAEGLLHGPQLLVAQHGVERVEIGVGAQHEDAVELRLLLDLVGIDGEVVVADRLEEAAKAGVADQRLVALGELALQRGQDRGAVGGVLLAPPDGCGRRCSAAPPASPPWPRSRSPCRASSSPAARTARDRRAPARAPACRCARARRGYTAAAAPPARPWSRR